MTKGERMGVQVNNHQWNGIVDLTNVTLMHDFHDVKMSRPDIDVELTVGAEGFELKVVPTKEQGMSPTFTPES
jgi:hypothetical protein